jgi:hypothetical protein
MTINTAVKNVIIREDVIESFCGVLDFIEIISDNFFNSGRQSYIYLPVLAIFSPLSLINIYLIQYLHFSTLLGNIFTVSKKLNF